MPKLSDTKIKAEIRKAIATRKGRKLYDELGLYLQLEPRDEKCSTWWRQKYFWAGKEKLLSLGVYPDVGLALARDKRDAIRKQVKNDIDPSADRREKKAATENARTNTFKAIALEWIEKDLRKRKNRANGETLTADHIERVQRRFELHVFPWIGSKSIGDVTEDDVLSCLIRLEDADHVDTATRTRAQCFDVFRYARRRMYVKHNPVGDLKGRETLPPVRVKHHSAITDPDSVGGLLRAIDAYDGSLPVKSALRLAPLLFVRPGELRHARWEEFKLDEKGPEWRIPAARMKMREQHIVPLSPQALKILLELEPLTGADGKGYVFPSNRNTSRPMSENTLNVALRACGYSKDQHTAHGFRSTASTLLNEKWQEIVGKKEPRNPDAIERQLAHGERDKVRGSYNYAEHLELRRRMMIAWANYLDKLKSPDKEAGRSGGRSNVVNIGRGRVT